MYPNHYVLEKLMEQHNRELEQINRRSWWNRQPKESKPSPKSEAPAAQVPGTCSGKENGICCQAYKSCQA